MTGAELLVHGGTIHTMDPQRPMVDAVAVAGGNIIAVGGAEVDAVRTARTDVVNLGGRALMPGFQDAHIHPLAGGLGQLECDLSELHDLQDYRRTIADYSRAHPNAQWIHGAGWYGDVFPGGFPDRTELDKLVAQRPAVFISHDAHGAWANSPALEHAGIDRHTPDPAGGRIVRDAQGEPTGMLLESAAELVTSLLPAVGNDQLERAMLTAQAYLHSLGITAWQDAAVGDALGIPDSLGLYSRLSERGLLTARVTGALWWQREGGLEQIADLVDRRASVPPGRFQATAVKIMQDGVCENLTAAVVNAYQGQVHNHGLSFIEPEQLNRIVAELDAQAFDVHLHAVGDRAVRECLDAVEGSGSRSWDSRHQIAHIDLVEQADIERMSRLGVIANVQPLWARHDPVLVQTKLPYLDASQQAHHFAFGSLLRAGVQLALGSDWPVSSPDPLWGIHVAVNRTAPPADPHAQDERSQTDPLLAGEAVDVRHALAAYTHGAARANRLDAMTGSLTRGKAADFVILDRDPADVPNREISSIRVESTFIEGEVVYSCQ